MASLSTSMLEIRRASKAHEKTKNVAFCKKHPKHMQSPGVCSLCLNERLSIFIKTTSSSYSSLRQLKARQIICSSSTTSLSSSSSVSSCTSPLVDRQSNLLMAGGRGREKGISWMTKSQSVAYRVDDEKRKNTRKGGFFFLFGGYKKREQESVVDY